MPHALTLPICQPVSLLKSILYWKAPFFPSQSLRYKHLNSYIYANTRIQILSSAGTNTFLRAFIYRMCVCEWDILRQRLPLFLHLVNPPSSQLQQLSPSHCEWRINLDVWMSIHIWFALVNILDVIGHIVYTTVLFRCWYVGVCVSSLTSFP